MTNFDPEEFNQIWNNFRDFIMDNYNTGRGRRCPHSGKDILFMTLTALKHGGEWDFLARLFGMKGPTFERVIMRFVHMLSGYVYDGLVTKTAELCTMGSTMEEKMVFKYYLFARYATDVTFQQSNRPSGNTQEGKRYFSGKHKLYGYKVEAAVLQNGLWIGLSRHYPQSNSDLEIFQKNVAFRKANLKEVSAEREIMDVGLFACEYPIHWAVLMDKGYQGALEMARAIIPKEKPHNGILSTSEESSNRKISSDRIIVENYFGRMGSL